MALKEMSDGFFQTTIIRIAKITIEITIFVP